MEEGSPLAGAQLQLRIASEQVLSVACLAAKGVEGEREKHRLSP
jgi:hypothetical protein